MSVLRRRPGRGGRERHPTGESVSTGEPWGRPPGGASAGRSEEGARRPRALCGMQREPAAGPRRALSASRRFQVCREPVEGLEPTWTLRKPAGCSLCGRDGNRCIWRQRMQGRWAGASSSPCAVGMGEGREGETGWRRRVGGRRWVPIQGVASRAVAVCTWRQELKPDACLGEEVPASAPVGRNRC